MATIITSGQMRDIEASHVRKGKSSWLNLMDRAADAVVDCMRSSMCKGRNAGRVHVLCGPGNNGGDGYAIACRLHDAGSDVTVLAYGRSPTKSSLVAHMRADWEKRGQVDRLDTASRRDFQAGDTIVDAIFGIGLNRPVDHDLLKTMATVPDGCRLIAVDILTGISADTGELMGMDARKARPADLTVTFESIKPGHVLGDGAVLTGELRVAPIGMADELAAVGKPVAILCEGGELPWDTYLAKHPLDHKYSHGHVLVLAGSASSGGKGGAARLAATAALRTGAGLVTIGADEEAIPDHAAHLNAVMLAAISSIDDLRTFLTDPRINCLVIGPGLGVGKGTREMTLDLLATGRSIVLDADALTSFESCPDALFVALHRNAVLTPHMGEFRRLFPDLATKATGAAGRSKIECAEIASSRCGATVVMKGHDTVVGSPGKSVMVICPECRSSAAWLSTAGSGDVLTGTIAGLMARGADAETASCMGAQLQIDTARIFGPGLISEDLLAALPAAIASRCLTCPAPGPTGRTSGNRLVEFS